MGSQVYAFALHRPTQSAEPADTSDIRRDARARGPRDAGAHVHNVV